MMTDEMFIEKYEELLDKGYCDCNEMNILDNNVPRKILNIVKGHRLENRQLKVEIKQLKEQLQQRDEVIDEAINHIKTKINNSFNYDYGFDTSNPGDRLFTETVIELQLVLEILNKYKGGNE